MIGSFHTDLAEYTRLLSGSQWLGRMMQEYMRWPYGKCERVFAPSEATRDMLIRARLDPARIDIWRRGVSTQRFDPAKRSSALREQWGVTSRRPALVCSIVSFHFRSAAMSTLILLASISATIAALVVRRDAAAGAAPMRLFKSKRK